MKIAHNTKWFVRLMLFVGLLPNISFASGAVDISQTDFTVRVINFVIFVAIVWYFVVPYLKNILQTRKDSISKRFEEVQEKIKSAKKAKEQANKQLDDAKKKADEIIAFAKQEASNIAKRYDELYKTDAENLNKSSQAVMEFEERKMREEIVQAVLKERFNGKAGDISSDEYVRILQKKVA